MYEPLTVLRRTPSTSAATAVTPSAVPAAAPRRQTTTPDSLTTSCHIDAVRCDEVLDGQRRHGEAVGRSERHEEECQHQ